MMLTTSLVGAVFAIFVAVAKGRPSDTFERSDNPDATQIWQTRIGAVGSRGSHHVKTRDPINATKQKTLHTVEYEQSSKNVVSSQVIHLEDPKKTEPKSARLTITTRLTPIIENSDERNSDKPTPEIVLTMSTVLSPDEKQLSRQQLVWPLAQYFPIIINDPFLAVYNSILQSSAAVNNFVEYGPEADICRRGNIESNMLKISKTRKPTQLWKNKLIISGDIPVERRVRSTRISVGNRQKGFSSFVINEDTERKNELTVRKGGVSIAGPGGAATAYTGGTAIVGPYGTVYKSPGGAAILGPYSKVVNITDNVSVEEILEMHKNGKSKKENSVQTMRSFRDLFSLPKNAVFVIAKDGNNVNETTLILNPQSRAEAGRDGVALSTPIGHAIIEKGQQAHIVFNPQSVANVGPNGFAHAHSDLLVTYTNKAAPGIP